MCWSGTVKRSLLHLSLHPPMNLAMNINLKDYSDILRDAKRDHLQNGTSVFVFSGLNKGVRCTSNGRKFQQILIGIWDPYKYT